MHQKPICLCVLLVTFYSSAWANDWPQFRGPGGQGHAKVRDVPLTWSEDSKNIAWRVPIDGLGWSSPVVQSDRIWLTSATDEGRSFHLICADLKSGRTIHDVQLFQRDEPLKIHRKNSHASPTPIVEDDRVYVHFGTYGTACVTTRGKVVWRMTLEYDHVHGPGGSPTVFEDLLILSCDGREDPFVVALEKSTGAIRWKTPRPGNPWSRKFAFATPLVINVDDEPQVVIPGAGSVQCYDPRNGEAIWQVDYPDGYSNIPRPLRYRDLVYITTGWGTPSLLAIRLGGQGNVTETHVAWSYDRAAPHSPSPLIVGDELYLVSDKGIATCLDALTGHVHWQKRLGGNFSASLLYAAGRIYFLDEEGTTTVVRPGKSYQELARNEITGQTLASLTPVQGAMLLRTESSLIRIDQQ